MTGVQRQDFVEFHYRPWEDVARSLNQEAGQNWSVDRLRVACANDATPWYENLSSS
jgi:hypothetical protein